MKLRLPAVKLGLVPTLLSPVFNNGSAPLDLMYRWGNDDRLFRIGTSLVYNTSTNYWNNADHKREDYYFRTNVFLGRERRSAVAKRWLVNYGGDLVFSTFQQNFRHESIDEESQRTARLSVQTRQTMKIGGGLRPFVGIMFKINDRLLVGTEASFLASMQNNSFSSKGYTLINGVRNDAYHNYKRGDSKLDINIRTQPASNVFVYYRF